MWIFSQEKENIEKAKRSLSHLQYPKVENIIFK